MSHLKVDKDEVRAFLYLSDGTTLDGLLYLSPFGPSHQGPQTVEDLMDEPGRVLPFRMRDGKFMLVGKGSVAAAALPASAGRPPGFWTVAPVSVRITGHHTLLGSLLLEEGSGKRLSDALNSPHTWIPLETGEFLVWLAKEHIVTVEAD